MEESLLWIGVLVHRFWVGGGVAPVGAGLEEVEVQGVAYLEKDIGVDPFAAHDFVKVLTSVANLLCQPGDASSLPRELRLDGLSDMKGVDRGVFMSVHNAVCLELTVSFLGNKKGGESFLLCAYLPLWYRQTPVTQISTE